MNQKKYSGRILRIFLVGLLIIAMSFFFKRGNANEKQVTESIMQDAVSETELHEAETEKTILDHAVEKTTEVLALQEWERIASLPAGDLAVAGTVGQDLADRLFYAAAINEEILSRINGKSFTENENISISDLSYLKMLYYGFDGNTYVGEMIVNQKIEAKVLEIFQTLYENKYPVERMVLIDEYDASDERSMNDNNTSAFNYRTISGSSKLSNHSYGMAIDLNPKYNPYVKTRPDGSAACQPESGADYADRSKDFAYKIDESDLAYRLFSEAGFTWGGSWNSVKDYQHFEMKP